MKYSNFGEQVFLLSLQFYEIDPQKVLDIMRGQSPELKGYRKTC